MPTITLGTDIVIDWNQAANETLVANIDKQNPGMASRTMAMLNLALYDGLAMVKSGGSLFYDYGTGHTSTGYSASGTAAAAPAAYTVLSSIYPDQAATLSSRLTASLSSVGDGTEKTTGIASGTMIGQSIVNSRTSDGFNNNVAYQPNPAAGHWQPDPPQSDSTSLGTWLGTDDSFCFDIRHPILPTSAASFDQPRICGCV